MNDKPKSGTERREPTRMELIPGAAYLSPSEKRVYIALEDGWARYDVGSASPGAVPADLILLKDPAMSSPVERLETWCDERMAFLEPAGNFKSGPGPSWHVKVAQIEAYRHLIARYRRKEQQANDSTLHIRLREQRAAEAQELEHVIAVIEEAVNPEEK